MCIEAGLDIYEVSRLLGHSDIRITQEVYSPICGRFLAGHGRAGALRTAMLSLRAEHPHPYYWAPFIAIGRDAPLRATASYEGR